jgi:hypothetical protein
MDAFSADWWGQKLAALMNAPILCLPLTAIVAVVVWWFRGTMFQPMIAGLREQIKVFGAQKTIFDAQMQLAAKELEAERGRQDSLARQINDLKVEVTAGAGIDALTARVAGLETSLNELATANNAVRSAFGVVVGTLAATELSDSFSNTPLALRAAQAEIINKWWK